MGRVPGIMIKDRATDVRVVTLIRACVQSLCVFEEVYSVITYTDISRCSVISTFADNTKRKEVSVSRFIVVLDTFA
jgi:hypothetical protein